MKTFCFTDRHNGPRSEELKQMLRQIGVDTADRLIDETIPASIRLKSPLALDDGMKEHEYLNHLRELGAMNRQLRSFIGLGYYNTVTPPVIQRNILENPGWYTSYTPYQAEISQGRLEALLNFQTMVSDLTALPIANASLLDEGTAAAEAMIMFFNARSRDAVKRNANKFAISTGVFPHTTDVVRTRANALGIEVILFDGKDYIADELTFGVLLQYPDQYGSVNDYRGLVEKARQAGVFVAVAADILSLALLTPPGEWGADAVVGSTQRFGIPLGFGGPHAGYFSCTEKFKRSIPGRIIGVSVDSRGKRALRMALQTREQHIKRERATSNICTAQALLAIMAGMYAAWHGREGIREIASNTARAAATLSRVLEASGFKLHNQMFFDTLSIGLPDGVSASEVQKHALAAGMNFRYVDANTIGISLDETVDTTDVKNILAVFSAAVGKKIDAPEVWDEKPAVSVEFTRSSDFLSHPVFNSSHSETEMMRYIKKLEVKDLALNRSMIPLGSCTMKLNAASELFALSWPEFGNIHPFVPSEQAAGYHKMILQLEKDLCEITGFAAISFQPNSGASGEYTGLMVIRAYHEKNGQHNRKIVLIPSSAHGTNPASAVMAGMEVVVVKCDVNGNIDVADLREKATQHSENLCGLMVTYPSTHGVFEENILEVIDIIHSNGGQVYMDGANMNAQVGYTSPGHIGADVCHLNLHKTFAIPHGGGGPGMGPIGVAAHLKELLPRHHFCECGGKEGIGAVSSAPFGSALILTISYGYIKMMGGKGLTEATKMAIVNANYLKARLEKHYPILYKGKNGHVAHEMILDCNGINREVHIDAIDIAKRLMDYGFHAPTVAFPVHGTLMVEPTESEPLSELDRFAEAMISIREEINEVVSGKADQQNNVVKNAPHTSDLIASDTWDKPYSREKAVFPVESLKEDKYWPTVTRIDDAYGDRNLVCTCEPIESYM